MTKIITMIYLIYYVMHEDKSVNCINTLEIVNKTAYNLFLACSFRNDFFLIQIIKI